jgi:hypothetical protein
MFLDIAVYCLQDQKNFLRVVYSCVDVMTDSTEKYTPFKLQISFLVLALLYLVIPATTLERRDGDKSE